MPASASLPSRPSCSLPSLSSLSFLPSPLLTHYPPLSVISPFPQYYILFSQSHLPYLYNISHTYVRSPLFHICPTFLPEPDSCPWKLSGIPIRPLLVPQKCDGELITRGVLFTWPSSEATVAERKQALLDSMQPTSVGLYVYMHISHREQGEKSVVPPY
jgi:hypothetical protein